ncbi:MAG: hypothetical protein Q7K16_01035 [Candidatus Azambacteria bacterium]|nr:hypothetical protein [Candidatus Azambacteria bacterium]
MKRILENVQTKPDAMKHIVMWVGIFLIMTAIFSFWLLTFSWQVSQTAENSSASELKKELPSVFNSLKSQTGLLFETMKSLGK